MRFWRCVLVSNRALAVGGLLGKTRAQKGITVLMHAAAKGHTECARLLLDAGADANASANVRVCVCRTAESAVDVYREGTGG